MRDRFSLAVGAALLLLIGAGIFLTGREDNSADAVQLQNSAIVDADKTSLGLFTTLPIYWGEGADFDAMLSSDTAPHWARSALEERHKLTPLDVLTDDTLAKLDQVMLAQPRALAGAENVALDNWVRAGGRALIFADPMLTEHSEFGLGDPRRPQDVVLLSPILTRWGLELTFDEDQPETDRLVALGGTPLVTRKAGQLIAAQDGEGAVCELLAQGLLARCEIGEGRALILADAAMLEGERVGPETAQMLDKLTGMAFRDSGSPSNPGMARE